jgi:hypothetical protein
VFIERIVIAGGSKDIFVRQWMRLRFLASSPVIFCEVCGFFVYFGGRYTARVLEARALLKVSLR